MTTATSRRVAKFEGAFHPREAVLAWLVEAQQYPSLVAHVRSIAELPVEATPLSVIGARVEAATRDAMRGQPRAAIEVAGRRFDTDITLTEFEANRKVAIKFTKPFPTTTTVTFESVAGGTRVSQTVESEPGGFFKMAESLLVTMARRQFQNDLDNLRDLMEAHVL